MKTKNILYAALIITSIATPLPSAASEVLHVLGGGVSMISFTIFIQQAKTAYYSPQKMTQRERTKKVALWTGGAVASLCLLALLCKDDNHAPDPRVPDSQKAALITELQRDYQAAPEGDIAKTNITKLWTKTYR